MVSSRLIPVRGQWIRGAVVTSVLGDLLVFVAVLSSACDASSLVLGLCEE